MEVEQLNKSSAKDKWHPEASNHGVSEEERQEQRKWMSICVHTKDLELESGGVGLPIAYSWQNGKGKLWLGNELKDRKPWADKGTEVNDGDEGLGDNCVLAAASTMPIISFLFLCRISGMSGSVGIFLGGACFLWLLGFVDKLAHFYFIRFMFFNPLTELKTGLIPTNTRWCGTQKHLRLRIGITMTKVWKRWKSIGTSCTRRNCLLCHCHGAHPGLVLTVAGRSWGTTPSTNFVERSVIPWKRRSMMSKKPLCFTPQHGSLLPQQLSSPTVHAHSSMLHTFVSLEDLCWWTVHEQFMASMLQYMNAVFSLLLLSVPAVALILAPSWWACCTKICGGLLCFAMLYRNEQKKPAMGFHPFTQKWSVSPLPDCYIQYNLSLQFHKIPMLSWQRELTEVLFYYLVQNWKKNPVTKLRNEGSCWHCDD